MEHTYKTAMSDDGARLQWFLQNINGFGCVDRTAGSCESHCHGRGD